MTSRERVKMTWCESLVSLYFREKEQLKLKRITLGWPRGKPKFRCELKFWPTCLRLSLNFSRPRRARAFDSCSLSFVGRMWPSGLMFLTYSKISPSNHLKVIFTQTNSELLCNLHFLGRPLWEIVKKVCLDLFQFYKPRCYHIQNKICLV